MALAPRIASARRRRDNDGGGASVGGLLRLLPIYILGRLRPASDASGPEDKT